MAKILIVEDNALNIKLFCDLLEAHGHQTAAVTDSRQALDTADCDLFIELGPGAGLTRLARAAGRAALPVPPRLHSTRTW